jgi:hypothetical protein
VEAITDDSTLAPTGNTGKGASVTVITNAAHLTPSQRDEAMMAENRENVDAVATQLNTPDVAKKLTAQRQAIKSGTSPINTPRRDTTGLATARDDKKVVRINGLSAKLPEIFNTKIKGKSPDLIEPPTFDKPSRREIIKMALGAAAAFGLTGVLKAAEIVQEKQKPGLATAKKMVLDHLNKILEVGKLRTDIPSTEYWTEEVFKGDENMFLFAIDDIEVALKAGLKPYNEGKALSAKEFARLAIKALEEQTPDEKLNKFFSGSWTRYIVSLGNNDKSKKILEEVIRQRAKDIDPVFEKIIGQLADNTDKWDAKDIESTWQKFNDDYLIPKGFYASVSTAIDNRTDHKLYVALIYKIESKEETVLSSGKKIAVLMIRRSDRVNFAGNLGHVYKGFERILIDLDAIERQIKTFSIMTEKDILPGGKKNEDIDLTAIRDALRMFNKTENFKQSLISDTKRHEMAHKNYEDLKSKERLKKGFGIYQSKFEEDAELADMAQSEIYAYLTQIRDGDLPFVPMLSLFRSFLERTPTPEFFAGSFIFNQFMGEELDAKDIPNSVKSISKFFVMANSEISKKAGQVLTSKMRENVLFNKRLDETN